MTWGGVITSRMSRKPRRSEICARPGRPVQRREDAAGGASRLVDNARRALLASRAPQDLNMPKSQHFGWATALAVGIVFALLAGCPGPNKVDRKKSLARLDLAKDFLSKGQLDAAENEANKALGYDSKSAEGKYLLGMVDYLRAVRVFQLLEVEDCLTGVDAEALG